MQKIITLYAFWVCMASATSCFAMDDTPAKGKIFIEKKELFRRVDDAVATATGEDDILKIATDIAQAYGMSERAQILALSIQHAQEAREHAETLPDFTKINEIRQQKMWEETLPYYVKILPRDCTVVVQKIDGQGNPLDLGEIHIMHANKCTIHKGQEVILSAISEYTRKKDGKLNADQLVACSVSLNDSKYLFTMRTGDVWQRIEQIIKEYLSDLP